jgi:hypothetical protein
VAQPEEPSVLARPGDARAHKVLKRHEKDGLALWAFVPWGIATVAGIPGLIIDPNLSTGLGNWCIRIFFSFFFLGCPVFAFAMWQCRYMYRKMVAAGRIGELDPHLVRIWDEMRTEERLALSREQRIAHLAELFEPAVELRSTLAEYHSVTEQPSRAADANLLEARIRATLRPFIQYLRYQQSASSELTQGLPQITAGPSQQDVAAELEQLERLHASSK